MNGRSAIVTVSLDVSGWVAEVTWMEAALARVGWTACLTAIALEAWADTTDDHHRRDIEVGRIIASQRRRRR